MKMRAVPMMLLAGTALTLGGADILRGQANPDVLVSTDWLADHLDASDLVLLHVAMGHDNRPDAFIPGAALLDYHDIAEEIGGLPIELPPVGDLQAAFREAGVSNDSRVVVYVDGTQHLAARVFMTLDYLGHGDRTAVLDGGFQAWRSEDRPVTDHPVDPTPGSFQAHPRTDLIVSSEWIASRLDDSGLTLIDARPEGEYTGDRPARDHRGGHIPGAYNLYWQDLTVSGEDSRLIDLKEVKARFEEAGASPGDVVVNYCLIGMRASYTYLITRYLGYDAKFYDASWVDWAPQTELPAVTGPDPR